MDKKHDKKNDEVKKLEKERDDFKDKYLRALADYHNFEKRAGEQRKEIAEQAKKHMILRLLPFLDHLEQAEVFIKDEGLKMIKNQFVTTLKGEGLEEIEVLQTEFDPYIAEAIDLVEGEKDNVIVEVVRKGYKLGDNIIRPAQVKVSKQLT